MKLLEDRIRKDGIVRPGGVLKVDSFINHQMDIHLFREMARGAVAAQSASAGVFGPFFPASPCTFGRF